MNSAANVLNNVSTEQKSESVKTENASGVNSNGRKTYTDPRCGKYHYSASGKKVYERK